MISYEDLASALTAWRVRNGLPVSQPVQAPVFAAVAAAAPRPAPPLMDVDSSERGTHEVDIGDEGTLVAADEHDDALDSLVDADSLVDEALE